MGKMENNYPPFGTKKRNILLVTDHGDPSVGMFPQYWEIPIPMQDIKEDPEAAEFFRAKIIEAYEGFADGKITAYFDYEIDQEHKDELRIDAAMDNIEHQGVARKSKPDS